MRIPRGRALGRTRVTACLVLPTFALLLIFIGSYLLSTLQPSDDTSSLPLVSYYIQQRDQGLPPVVNAPSPIIAPIPKEICTEEVYSKTYDTHKDFYTTTAGCLALATSMTIPVCNIPTPLLFHINWNFLLNNNHDIIAMRAKIVIKSILVNHPKISKVIIWTDTPQRASDYLYDLLSDAVEVRKWDNLEEALTTPLAYTMQRKNLVRNDERNWKGGDLMRIIVLWKHGGVYVDLDTLILRPLTPLLNQDFVYQWSCQRDEANGAVMYATRPRSWMMQQFMDELPRVENDEGANFMWGKDLMSSVKHRRGGNFTIFPCCFFDPMWYNFDSCDIRASWIRYWDKTIWRPPILNYPWNFDDFFTDTYPLYNISAFFPGAFAVHWHNNWDKVNATLSPFSVIAQDIEERFLKLFTKSDY